MFSKNKGTVIGTPGASSRQASSKIRQGFARLSWKARIALSGFGVVAGLATALALGFNPLTGIALLAAFALFISGLFAAPAIWGVILVLATYAVAAVPLAGALVSQSAGFVVPFHIAVESSLSLMTASLLTSWIAMRFSRIAPWKSLSTALLGSAALGFIAAFIVPAYAFNITLISMFMIVAFWCGLRDVIVGGVSWLADAVKGNNSSEPIIEEVTAEDPLRNRARAEQLTAKTLSSIHSQTIVFHDVATKTSGPIPHVVISTTAVSLMHSISSAGHIHETKNEGLIIPGLDMNRTVSNMLEQRNALASTLKIKPEAVRLVLAVHSKADIHGISRSFAVYDNKGAGRKITDIHVVSSDMLLDTVDTGLDMWNPLERRAVTRRATMKLKPAHLYAVSNTNEESMGSDELRLSAIDSDGRETGAPLSSSESAMFSWMKPGTPVLVETAQGLIGDVVLTGNIVRQEDSSLMVPVCAMEEWEAAEDEERAPESHWFSVEKIFQDK